MRPIVLSLVLMVAPLSLAQAPATQSPASPAPIVRSDAALDLANAEIGRALFLRCFCAEDNLAFTAQGQPASNIKLADWTLAGVNIQKVERHSATEIELDGVRVAVRYAPDRHEFDRHPLNDDKVRILLPAVDARQVAAALDAMFAQGIDPALQRAMPPYWRHYFDPALAWMESGKPDALSGQAILTAGGDVSAPSATHRAEPTYPVAAQHDRVQGKVGLRLVVDAAGAPQRVTIAQPLGYGLDRAAAESVEKYRFTPGERGGKPVAVGVLVNQDFILVAPPR